MIRSGNPALNANVFQKAGRSTGQSVMTLQGTVNKTFIMLALLVVTATFV